ncbi:family 78 glycoside hydrolase catalytic domain [Halobacteria archaeon AArc-m2/3/4]|uniref:alpha-L-rhamnosidase n=1 Tax=Natronoglomus mannanivorans TaxID=2979990 RepID=A0ABT2QF42_9EURY|nr:family 78 glycoside hydrolase catalytic domain [Halobacteria archaeon AArc-m2/3/4]
MTGHVRPTALRVNDRSNPTALPRADPPRFSWRIDDPSWGTEQSAYRLLLARSREALESRDLLWDTGRVDSSRTTNVAYNGPQLAPDSRYWWTVRVWNDEGDATAFADPASFGTAPTTLSHGRWIAHQPEPGDSNGYRSQWRSSRTDSEWVQVDLGKERTVERVDLYPAEPFGGPTTPDGRPLSALDTEDSYHDSTVADGPVGFGFPERYRIEASNDASFTDSQTLVDRTDAELEDPGREPVSHDVETASARYVRVTVTALPTYEPRDDRLREEQRTWAAFALAALAVRDEDGTDIALERPVTASSSVEREGDGWGRTHITNGTYASEMASTSPLFRTEIDLEKPVATARLHVAALGYGELYINGERIGDGALDPAWTDYDERVCYRTYEVDDRLEEGRNAVGLWLGRGWFGKGARQWNAFGSPRALLSGTVEYEDGTTREFGTDDSWAATASPIVANDIYDGETYDGRLEREGWAEPGFDDRRGSDEPSDHGERDASERDTADWVPATVVDGPDGTLYPQQTRPIAVAESLEPVDIYDHEDGPILDFGQNHTGWLELTVRGGDRGDEIAVRHAEALDEDGGLRTVDLRTAETTDRYVVGGSESENGVETYEPRFTYHGYRYAQIEGYPGDLRAADVRSKVVHTAMDDVGSFACSDEDLTAVQRNARWGLRTNVHSVPTDCPQRDERQGFTGDGHLAARALLYNFDAGHVHEKWSRDHDDAQSRHGYLPSKVPFGSTPANIGPSWTASRITVPWHVYCFSGNERVLAERYENLTRYVEYYHEVAAGGDDGGDGNEDESGLLPEEHTCYGDWLALENADGRVGEPTGLFTNAYYYRITDVLSEIAAVLGCDDDATRHRERADAIAAAFDDRYFDETEFTYGPGTQAACAVPLFFGMVSEDRADEVAASLAERVRAADGQLRTGFLGTRALLGALTEYGYADLAYRVASQPEFPGWVYMLRQGATTVWERWDSDSDEHIGSRMNSLNHSPFTYVSEWFFDSLAGLEVSEALPEERTIEIEPAFVADLEWVSGSLETPAGEVGSRWERTADGYELTVDVPWNLRARLRLPADGGGHDNEEDGDGTDSVSVAVDGRRVRPDEDDTDDRPEAVQSITREDGHVVLELAAGSHTVGLE